MPKIKLRDIAHARSGDKGCHANIAVIANDAAAYATLEKLLTAERVQAFFQGLAPCRVIRYEVPKWGALNFVLEGILGEGGSRSLRIDAQGKVLGQALLQLEI